MRGTVLKYAAQEIPQIDPPEAEKRAIFGCKLAKPSTVRSAYCTYGGLVLSFTDLNEHPVGGLGVEKGDLGTAGTLAWLLVY